MEGLPSELIVAIVRIVAFRSLGEVWKMRLVSKRMRDVVEPLTRYRTLVEHINLDLEWRVCFSPEYRTDGIGWERWLAEGPRVAGKTKKELEAALATVRCSRKSSNNIPVNQYGELQIDRRALVEKCRAEDGGRVIVGLGHEDVTIDPDENGDVWLGLMPMGILNYSYIGLRAESGVAVRVWYYSCVDSTCVQTLSGSGEDSNFSLYIGGVPAVITDGGIRWEGSYWPVLPTSSLREWLSFFLGRLCPAWAS